MATEFNINRFKNLPTGGKNGEIQILEKPNNRFETYIVKPDGSKAFSKGITDEQESKINSVTAGDITKLKEDYTKAEIDTKITNLGNLATSSKINLGDSTVLPVPPQSGGVTIPNAWVELAQGVTYTQSGGSPITGIDGHRSIAEWDNDNEVWSLVDMGELPQVEGTDVLNPQGEGVPKEKATADYVKPLFDLTIEEDTEPIPLSVVQDRIINQNGDSIVLEGWARSSITMPSGMLSIGGDTLYYSGDIISTGLPTSIAVGVAYFDDNLNFLGHQFSDIGTYVDVLLQPPIGATLAACCGYGGFTIKKSVYKQKEPSRVDGEVIYGDIKTDQLISIEETTDFINTKIIITEEPQSIALTPGALTNDGGINANITRCLRTSNGQNLNSVVHVQPNTDYYYTGRTGIYSIGVAIQYYDINQIFIGYDIPFISVEVDYVKEKLILPPNAAYIACCSYDYAPIVSIINKELVADKSLQSDSNYIYVDAINGDDEDGTGTGSYPFASINKAIASIKGSAAVIIVSEGDYRETIDLGSLPSGKFKIVNRESHRVRALGSNQLTGWVKTEGFDNVYEIPFSDTIPNWSRNANPIYENGNASDPIAPEDRHPLHRNLSHRLPFTPILAETSIENVDGTPGTYIVSGGKLYIHTTNSDDPETNGFSYENAVRAANTVNNAVTTNKKVELEIKGIQFYFNTSGVRSIGFDKVKFINCVSMGTHAAGAFAPNTGFNHFINCEAAYCNGDGFNGHFNSFTGYQNLTDNRSNYPTTIYEQCWAHNNFDDGESSHENHNVIMLRCLFEYNGDSGCRPSNDATYYVADCMFRHNGWEVGVGTNRGEGFAVVNPPLSDHRQGCRAILYNCVSYGNNIGYGAISSAENYVELVNCTSRDNTTAEYFVNNGAKLRLRNCRGYNADLSKLKVTANGVIEVINEELVV